MDLLESINVIAKEIEETEQQIRELVAKKAETLKTLASAKSFIDEVFESAKTKPVTIPISSVAGLDDLSRKHLKDAGIEFLEDIAKMKELEASKIPGLGVLAFSHICAAMLKHNLNFAT